MKRWEMYHRHWEAEDFAVDEEGEVAEGSGPHVYALRDIPDVIRALQEVMSKAGLCWRCASSNRPPCQCENDE